MTFKKEIRKRAIKNSLWGFIASMISKVGGLLLTIILARVLMPEGYGIYSLVLSVAMIFCTLSDLGISNTFIRYLSFALAKEKKKATPYHFYILKLKVMIISIISLTLFISAYPLSIYVFKNPDLFPLLLVAAVYIFILSFEGFYNSVFYSIEKIKYISLKEIISQTLRITLVLIAVFLISSSYQNKIMGVFWALSLNSLIILFLILYYLKKLIPELFKKSKKNQKIDKSKIKSFLGYLSITSISGIFFSYIDSIMLGFYVSPEYIGYYRASAALIFGIIGILSFFNVILLSLFAKIDVKETHELLIKSLKYSSLITLPIGFGLLVLGRYFIYLFYGTNYLQSTYSLYALSFLIFPIVSIGILISLFTAEEKPKVFTKLVLFTGILNIILNILLIRFFVSFSQELATVGAALATLISWYIYFLAAVYFIKKEFNLKIKLREILPKPLLASLIMFIALKAFVKYSQGLNIVTAIIFILGGFLIYSLIILLINGISRNELKSIYSSIVN